MDRTGTIFAAMVIAVQAVLIPGCSLFSSPEPPPNIGWKELLAVVPELFYKHECMQRVRPNVLKKKGYEYPSFSGWPGVAPGMFERFNADQRSYSRMIIGDSTAHSWQTIPGLTTGWRNTAVGGNRICNMIAQSRKYASDDIREVIISTNGGNDILASSGDDELLKDIRELFKRVRVLFPRAKITVVGVHPIMDGGLYKKIEALNNEVAKMTRGQGICYLNPRKVLGVDPDGRLPARYRLKLDDGSIDQIHYNQEAAKAVFAAAATCRRR